jgi:hypothetical protein
VKLNCYFMFVFKAVRLYYPLKVSKVHFIVGSN